MKFFIVKCFSIILRSRTKTIQHQKSCTSIDFLHSLKKKVDFDFIHEQISQKWRYRNFNLSKNHQNIVISHHLNIRNFKNLILTYIFNRRPVHIQKFLTSII